MHANSELKRLLQNDILVGALFVSTLVEVIITVIKFCLDSIDYIGGGSIFVVELGVYIGHIISLAAVLVLLLKFLERGRRYFLLCCIAIYLISFSVFFQELRPLLSYVMTCIILYLWKDRNMVEVKRNDAIQQTMLTLAVLYVSHCIVYIYFCIIHFSTPGVDIAIFYKGLCILTLILAPCLMFFAWKKGKSFVGKIGVILYFLNIASLLIISLEGFPIILFFWIPPELILSLYLLFQKSGYRSSTVSRTVC